MNNSLATQLIYWLTGIFLLFSVTALLLWLWQKNSYKTATTTATSKLTVKSLWIRRLIWLPIAAFIIVPWLSSWRKPVPPVPAPVVEKTPPQRHVAHFPLNFQGGENVEITGDGCFLIRNGGNAIFRAREVPWSANARYQVVFCLIKKKSGKLYLELNGGRGGPRPFDLVQYASNDLEPAVFFACGKRGEPDYFVPGTNRVKFWSPGDDILVQSARIEVEYWE